MPLDDDDDEEVLPVPVDRATLAWLSALCAETGDTPARAVASMIHDIRLDDEAAERPTLN